MKSLSGATCICSFAAYDSVQDLHNAVSCATAIPPHLFYLTHCGSTLPSTALCRQVGIVAGTTLVQRVRLQGGAKPKTIRTRSDSGSRRVMRPSPSAPAMHPHANAPVFDPWAGHQPSSAPSDVEMAPAPCSDSVTRAPAETRLRRAAWHQLQLLDDQFATTLPVIPLSALRVDAIGIAFVRRDQVAEILQISSSGKLALIVPGHSTKDFPPTASHATTLRTTLVVFDPALKRKELQNVAVVSVGRDPVNLRATEKELTPSPTVEVAVLATRSNFEADNVDWSSFVARLRAETKRRVVELLEDTHHSIGLNFAPGANCPMTRTGSFYVSPRLRLHCQVC